MSWSTPRTWTDGEVPTATHFNELRDQLEVLKVSRDDTGKVPALSASYLADLSAADLTGLAKPGAANAYTAGVHSFNSGSARVVLPVGADKADGPGSLWVEGDYLHWLDSTSGEWRYLGVYVSTPAGAVAGSCWVESNDVHYIDEDGDERAVAGTAAHNDAAARSGSIWMETNYAAFINSATREYVAHLDTHADSAHTDTHDDVAHEDVAHTDSHSDFAHTDTHDDVAHDDVAHVDEHGDEDFEEHPEEHVDFHNDVAHEDVAHVDDHADSAHVDAHTDVEHEDVAHVDEHSDGGHADTHSDKPEAVA